MKRITELFILEGDLWRSSSQTSLLQNRLIAARCSGLWLVKFWLSPWVETPQLPGQPVLVFSYPVNKTVSLMFKCSFLYSICAHWLLPVLDLSGPVFFTVSFRYLYTLSRCPQSFIFAGLDSPSSLCFLVQFPALASIFPCHTSAVGRESVTSPHLERAISFMQPRLLPAFFTSVVYCWLTVLDLNQCGVHQSPRSFSAELLSSSSCPKSALMYEVIPSQDWALFFRLH